MDIKRGCLIELVRFPLAILGTMCENSVRDFWFGQSWLDARRFVWTVGHLPWRWRWRLTATYYMVHFLYTANCGIVQIWFGFDLALSKPGAKISCWNPMIPLYPLFFFALKHIILKIWTNKVNWIQTATVFKILISGDMTGPSFTLAPLMWWQFFSFRVAGWWASSPLGRTVPTVFTRPNGSDIKKSLS